MNRRERERLEREQEYQRRWDEAVSRDADVIKEALRDPDVWNRVITIMADSIAEHRERYAPGKDRTASHLSSREGGAGS